jgi:hypothetical protein
MAVRRQQSVVGFVAALVVVGIMLLLAVVAAVLGWNAANKQDSTVKAARKTADEATNEAKAQKEEAGKLRLLLVGDDRATLESINDAIKAKLGDTLKPGSFLTATIGDLHQQLDQKARELASAQGEVKKARDDAKRAQQEKAQLEPGFEAKAAAFAKQAEEMQRQTDEFKKSTEKQLESLNEDLKNAIAAREKAAVDAQAKLDRADLEIKSLNDKIAQLKPRRNTPQGVYPSTLPKGEIVSVVADQSTVIINLGRADHLPLGITFEVFGPNQLISKNVEGELRGKATIEVVRVMDQHSAQALVVRMDRGATLQESDVIGNVVYDPHMVFKFRIFGDFDLDSVGRADPEDQRRIENMVREWGGKVVDNVDYDTDYLVLGAEPSMPEELKGEDKLDHRKMKEYLDAKAKFETYQALLGEARGLRIPILNQNRFLALVGYYQRMSVGVNR